MPRASWQLAAALLLCFAAHTADTTALPVVLSPPPRHLEEQTTTAAPSLADLLALLALLEAGNGTAASGSAQSPTPTPTPIPTPLPTPALLAATPVLPTSPPTNHTPTAQGFVLHTADSGPRQVSPFFIDIAYGHSCCFTAGCATRSVIGCAEMVF